MPLPKVANYITKLRGLKLKKDKTIYGELGGCKLYHKTTWFETLSQSLKEIGYSSVANYITKLRGLKLIDLKKQKKGVKVLQIISQNYVV